MKTTWIGGMIWVFCFTLSANAAVQTIEVAAATADEHVVKKVEPIYPPLAKTARIQGKVVLEVRIAKDGSVVEVKVKSGHPLLVLSAMQAVKQWQFKPFTSDGGEPVEATATIEVPFSLGIPEDQYKKDQEINDAYFKHERECRSLIDSRNYEQAEARCKEAAGLADQLPSQRSLERTQAYGDTGWVLIAEKKFAEALDYFRREVSLDEKALKPTDAELGYGYHHLGIALFYNGDSRQAIDYYKRSIKTLELAREHIQQGEDGSSGSRETSDFLKAQYAKTLKTVLHEYAQISRENGDAAAADAAEREADSLPK